eukprot:18700-Heterococcus_DN1.PRE.2
MHSPRAYVYRVYIVYIPDLAVISIINTLQCDTATLYKYNSSDISDSSSDNTYAPASSTVRVASAVGAVIQLQTSVPTAVVLVITANKLHASKATRYMQLDVMCTACSLQSKITASTYE